VSEALSAEDEGEIGRVISAWFGGSKKPHISGPFGKDTEGGKRPSRNRTASPWLYAGSHLLQPPFAICLQFATDDSEYAGHVEWIIGAIKSRTGDFPHESG